MPNCWGLLDCKELLQGEASCKQIHVVIKKEKPNNVLLFKAVTDLLSVA